MISYTYYIHSAAHHVHEKKKLKIFLNIFCKIWEIRIFFLTIPFFSSHLVFRNENERQTNRYYVRVYICCVKSFNQRLSNKRSLTIFFFLPHQKTILQFVFLAFFENTRYPKWWKFFFFLNEICSLIHFGSDNRNMSIISLTSLCSL